MPTGISRTTVVPGARLFPVYLCLRVAAQVEASQPLASLCPCPVPLPFKPTQVGVFAALCLILSTSPPTSVEICVPTNSHNHFLITKRMRPFACFLTARHHLAPVLTHAPLSLSYLGYKRRVSFRGGKGEGNQN